MEVFRIGIVSKIDYESGRISVTYPWRGDTTQTMPYLQLGGEYHMPRLEQRVAVLHLSTGNEVGVAIGPYWDGGAYTPPVTGKDVFYKDLSNIPGKAYMQHDAETGEMVLKADKIILNTSAGEISVADIIAAIGGA